MLKTRMLKPPLGTASLGFLDVVSGDRRSGCPLIPVHSQGSTIILQPWIHPSPQCQMVFKHTQTGEASASNNWMLAAVQGKPDPLPSSGASPNFCFNGQARDCFALSQNLRQLLKVPHSKKTHDRLLHLIAPWHIEPKPEPSRSFLKTF